MARGAKLRFVVAFGAAKLTRAESALPSPSGMVLELADLPDGWFAKSRIELRSGMTMRGTPWADRMRAAKGRSCIASFRFGDDRSLVLQSQAIPFASVGDARDAFLMIFESTGFFDLLLVERSREQVELPAPVGDEHRCAVVHAENARRPGIELEAHVLMWRRDSVIACFATVAPTGTWTLKDLVRIAERQDLLTRSVLSTFGEAAAA